MSHIIITAFEAKCTGPATRRTMWAGEIVGRVRNGRRWITSTVIFSESRFDGCFSGSRVARVAGASAAGAGGVAVDICSGKKSLVETLLETDFTPEPSFKFIAGARAPRVGRNIEDAGVVIADPPARLGGGGDGAREAGSEMSMNGDAVPDPLKTTSGVDGRANSWEISLETSGAFGGRFVYDDDETWGVPGRLYDSRDTGGAGVLGPLWKWVVKGLTSGEL